MNNTLTDLKHCILKVIATNKTCVVYLHVLQSVMDEQLTQHSAVMLLNSIYPGNWKMEQHKAVLRK